MKIAQLCLMLGIAATVTVAYAADPPLDAVLHAAPRPLSPQAVTHDWPAFLGPTGDAHSAESNLLLPWPQEGPTLVWEIKKGTGYTSPAIVGDRLVLFHRQGDQEVVECVHRETAQRFWRYAWPTTYRDRYGFNNGPRSSPVIDAGRVFAIGAQAQLHCLSLDTGEPLWHRDLTDEYKLNQEFFGYGATPLIDAGRLIVPIGAPGTVGGPELIAVDPLTGKTLWQGGDRWGASYASPVAATLHGKRRLLLFAGAESKPPTGGLVCFNPESGAVDFRVPWRSTDYESVNAANPVVVGNQIFITASYQTGGALIDVTRDLTAAIQWKNTVGAHFNTPVHDAGYLYAFDGRNIPDASLVCVDLKSGQVMWRRSLMWDETIVRNGREITQKMSVFRGTLLKLDKHFLCLGEAGHLLLLDLSPAGCKELARTRLFLAQETWSLPVLSRGLLYISQHSRDMLSGSGPRLLCYDLRAP